MLPARSPEVRLVASNGCDKYEYGREQSVLATPLKRCAVTEPMCYEGSAGYRS